MASLLPAVHGGAPILAMSGGSMSGASMLPAAPPVNIAAMSGGASLLPHAPDVPMIAMRGGGVDAASFGIVNVFDGDKVEELNTSSCAPMTETPTPCDILQPFVDRRVQALLKRVGFPSGNVTVDMGCGSITREGTQLTISFHEKAITLLSCDLTGTFAKFHESIPRHIPRSVEDSNSKGLLPWMLGSDVDEGETFNLITFMDQMKGGSSRLPLKGFRQFLSYHKEKSENEEMDVLRHAMKLYGYRTGAVDTKDVYGLILSPTTAVRRVDKAFAVYDNGKVTPGEWDPAWNSSAGFAVFEPVVKISSTASAASNGASTASTAASVRISPPASIITTSHGPSGTSTSSEMIAANKALALSLSLQTANHPILPVKSLNAAPFSSKKIEHNVTVGDTQKIGGKYYHLRGMIYHRGGDKGGHYIYFYRDPTNLTNSEKQWIRFDDEKPPTYEARPKEIDTGYVYLFERDGLNSKPIPKGIINNGNYCWMNAALQMFYHIPEYRAYIQHFDDNNSPLPKDMIATTIIIKQIFELYTNAPSLGHAVCTPQHKQLATSLFQGDSTNQQDTMEFIRNVLLYIIAPLDSSQKINGKNDDPVAAKVYSYFTIQEMSRSVCATNASIGPFEGASIATEITLSIPGPSSLDNLLQNHSLPEKITDATHLYGKDCDDIHRTITLTSLDSTKYVIIVLKRFEKV